MEDGNIEEKFYRRFPFNTGGREPQFLRREVFRNGIPSTKEQPKKSVKERLISAMEGLSLTRSLY